MPRRNAHPKYRLHKASGQAVVTLNGHDFYLGQHGTKASRVLYDRRIAEWLAAGRRLPSQHQVHSRGTLTVLELSAAYLEWAKGYYQKNGKPTGSVERVRAAARCLKSLYGRLPAVEFGPLRLRAVQEKLIAEQKSRRYINHITEQVKRMFKWGVSMELVSPAVFQAIDTVPGLRKGRCSASEPDPIGPVTVERVERTLPHLPSVVADMVRFQRLTGCRPGEVCIARPCDVDTSGKVWKFVPESHKTEHHGRGRVVLIGPKAQDVLRPYLLRPAQTYCFSPAESERNRSRERHDSRVTPPHAGNAPGTNRKRRPKRRAGDRYATGAYGRAITRACEVAFGMPEQLRKIPKVLQGADGKPLDGSENKAARRKLLDMAAGWRKANCWQPNQLRHFVGTLVRREFGLEAAQCVLGHAHANVTQVYAERDMQRAAEVMERLG